MNTEHGSGLVGRYLEGIFTDNIYVITCWDKVGCYYEMTLAQTGAKGISTLGMVNTVYPHEIGDIYILIDE